MLNLSYFYCQWDTRDDSPHDPSNYGGRDYHHAVTTPDNRQPNSSNQAVKVGSADTGVPDWFGDAYDQSMQSTDNAVLGGGVMPAMDNSSSWLHRTWVSAVTAVHTFTHSLN